jgi:DNA-binding NtrC family response regulator
MGGILLVEDDKNLREILKRKIKVIGHPTEAVGTGEEAKQLIENKSFDVVVIDIRLPDIDGIEIIKEFSEKFGTKFIVITGYGDVNTAVRAMKNGAYDFIQKPFSFDILEVSIKKALKEKKLEDENKTLKRILKNRGDEFILETKSKRFRELLDTIETVAQSDASILIRGETGTGKEIIARYIHEVSPRRDKPFVVVDCTSIPEHLFESELFGYERGAFTGATQKKLGLVEIADGGTLFLDEIGELPLSIQAKLLRFVESRKFRRVGGLREIEVDIRILSATNRDLYAMANAGEFRQDLLYRLNTIEIEVPPLRERKEDIPILVKHFLRKYKKKIRENTLEKLKEMSWKGNIRELKNTIERAVVLSRGEYIDESLCLGINTVEGCAESIFEQLPDLKSLERAYLEFLYKKFDGDVDKIATVLGCSRRTVFRKLKSLRNGNGNPKEATLPGEAINLN